VIRVLYSVVCALSASGYHYRLPSYVGCVVKFLLQPTLKLFSDMVMMICYDGYDDMLYSISPGADIRSVGWLWSCFL